MVMCPLNESCMNCSYSYLGKCDESIVSPVSRRYMRVVNGSLVVCLSDILVIKVHIGHESSVGVTRRHYEYIVQACQSLETISAEN